MGKKDRESKKERESVCTVQYAVVCVAQIRNVDIENESEKDEAKPKRRQGTWNRD